MFWNSVLSGLNSLLDWHILLGSIAVTIIILSYPVLTGALIMGTKSRVRIYSGYFMMLFGRPLVQALAVSIFILFCLPAILGNGGFTPANLISFLLWPVMKTGIISAILLFFLSLMPVIGRLIIDIPGVALFLQGIFVLRPAVEGFYSQTGNGREIPESVFPPFMYSAGFIAISLIICGVIFLAIASGCETLKKDSVRISYAMDGFEPQLSENQVITGALTGPISGTLPTLMYGKYTGLITGALTGSLSGILPILMYGKYTGLSIQALPV